MAKEIDIKLSSQADLEGFRKASEALANMAKTSAEAGASMSNAERRQIAALMSVRSAADKAAHGVTLSAKQIAEAWRKHLDEVKGTTEKAFDTSALVRATGQLKGLGEVAGKVGEAFGGATSYLGQFVKNLAFGGIWQAGAALLGFATKKVIEFVTASERAEKEAAKAAIEACNGRVKAVGEYQAAIEKCHAASVAAADARRKQISAEIDATKDLQKAELELERERRRTAGDSAGMAKAEMSALGDAYFVSTITGGHMAFRQATDEQRRAAGDAAVAEWEKSDERGKLAEARKSANAALTSAADARRKAEDELAAAESHLANLETKAEALRVREEAKAQKTANDAADETRAAEVKAAQDAARERERLDRELHQKRMADLREELAAQSEFNRARQVRFNSRVRKGRDLNQSSQILA